MGSKQRVTWIDSQGVAWRVERILSRWQLSRYWPSTEQWQRISSWPTRADAIQAAYNRDER